MSSPRTPAQGPALLIELVNETLDPGYAAAAKRRGGLRESPPWYARGASAIAAALIGFLLVAAWVHENRSAPESTKVHNALVQQVRAAQSAGDSLDAQARALADRVDAQRNAALGSGTPADLANEQLLAGTTAAKGPGLQVTLNEAKVTSTASVNTRQGSVPIHSRGRALGSRRPRCRQPVVE